MTAGIPFARSSSVIPPNAPALPGVPSEQSMLPSPLVRSQSSRSDSCATNSSIVCLPALTSDSLMSLLPVGVISFGRFSKMRAFKSLPDTDTGILPLSAIAEKRFFSSTAHTDSHWQISPVFSTVQLPAFVSALTELPARKIYSPASMTKANG